MLTITGFYTGFHGCQCAEADAAGLGLGFYGRHELADGVEYHLELAVVFLFEFDEFACQMSL